MATAVRSEVPGRVVWVSPDFEGGGFVAAGEPLVRMDPAAFELAVASAQAAVEGAEAQVWLEEALGEENEREFLLANPDGEPSAWVRREPHAALAQAAAEAGAGGTGLGGTCSWRAPRSRCPTTCAW